MMVVVSQEKRQLLEDFYFPTNQILRPAEEILPVLQQQNQYPFHARDLFHGEEDEKVEGEQQAEDEQQEEDEWGTEESD